MPNYLRRESRISKSSKHILLTSLQCKLLTALYRAHRNSDSARSVRELCNDLQNEVSTTTIEQALVFLTKTKSGLVTRVGIATAYWRITAAGEIYCIETLKL